jgi:hypothetical protein
VSNEDPRGGRETIGRKQGGYIIVVVLVVCRKRCSFVVQERQLGEFQCARVGVGDREEERDGRHGESGSRVHDKEKRHRVRLLRVYDGHGGPHVARACEERFHGVMVEVVGGDQGRDNDEGVEYWERVMEGCFGKMDEEVRGNGVGKTVGSTAVVAVVGEEEVVVANCGDSRAVMCSGGVALALSKDHKVRVLCTFSFYCFDFPKMKNATKKQRFKA